MGGTRPKFVVVQGSKGGIGKSLLAANLAAASAVAGHRTALVDFDRQKSSYVWLQQRRKNEGMPQIEALQGDPANEDDAREVFTLTDMDFVFVDTPSVIDAFPRVMAILADKSDLVIIPTRASMVDLNSNGIWIQAVKEMGRDHVVVLNSVRKRTNAVTSARRRVIKMGGNLCPIEIPEYSDFPTFFESGVSVIDVPKSSCFADIDALWTFVADRLSAGVRK